MSEGPTGRSRGPGARPRSSAGTDDHAELLRRSAGGDEAAFAQLYDATCTKLFGLVVRLTRSPDLAAEVVQEVYLMAWQQAERFDPQRGTVLAWLCTMAHRRAVDRIRQSQRERVRDEQYELRQAGPSADATWGEVEQSLETEEVRTGLGALSEIQREAVCLVYYRGYTHRQVAEHLAVPLGTAKARIRDGLNNLRTALGVQR